MSQNRANGFNPWMFFKNESGIAARNATASAQTTVITRERVETRTVMTTQPLELTPVQRQTIYRTIVREPVEAVPLPPTVEYRVGTRGPESVQLYSVRQDVVAEVPAIRPYKYMRVNGHVVPVDLATTEMVADFAD